MIVDGLTMVGYSINGYGLGVEELLVSINSNGIDKCVIAPVQPRTYRLEPQNDAVAVAQMRYPDRFIGFCRVDPRQGMTPSPSYAVACCDKDSEGCFCIRWRKGTRSTTRPLSSW